MRRLYSDNFSGRIIRDTGENIDKDKDTRNEEKEKLKKQKRKSGRGKKDRELIKEGGKDGGKVIERDGRINFPALRYSKCLLF